MTTVAAASVGGVHALAADGMTCDGPDVIALRNTKLHGYGSAVIAGAGNLSTSNILAKLDHGGEKSVSEVVEFLRREYRRADWKSVDGEVGAPIYGQEQLIVTDEGIWKIGVDLSILEVETTLPVAIGAGADYAIGAMESMRWTFETLTARDLVLHAVHVAMKRDNATGGSIMLALRGAETFGPEWVA